MGINDDVIRVAVVREGKPLSGTWRIWRRSNDIYVAPRSVASSFKISLHASGKFRFGFTSDEKASKFLRLGEDRAVFKWELPSSESPTRLLAQIIFPEVGLLAPNISIVLPKNLVPLTVPNIGNSTVISLVETELPQSVTELSIPQYLTRTLAKWNLGDQRQFWVLEHEELSSSAFNEGLKTFRTKAFEQLQERSLNLPSAQSSHLRTFVSLHSPDNVIRFVDIEAESVRRR
jgi:hypothetical protein